MRRMLLVVLAAASVTLSAGAAFAEQVVVCAPNCGVTSSTEAKQMHRDYGQAKAAAVRQNGQHGANNNNSGSGNTGGGGDDGGTIMIVF